MSKVRSLLLAAFLLHKLSHFSFSLTKENKVPCQIRRYIVCYRKVHYIKMCILHQMGSCHFSLFSSSQVEEGWTKWKVDGKSEQTAEPLTYSIYWINQDVLYNMYVSHTENFTSLIRFTKSTYSPLTHSFVLKLKVRGIKRRMGRMMMIGDPGW